MGYYVTCTGEVTLRDGDVPAAFEKLKGHSSIPQWLSHVNEPTFDDLLWSMFEDTQIDDHTIQFAGCVKWRQDHLDFFEIIAPFVRDGEVHFIGEDHASEGYRWTNGVRERLVQTWVVMP